MHFFTHGLLRLVGKCWYASPIADQSLSAFTSGIFWQVRETGLTSPVWISESMNSQVPIKVMDNGVIENHFHQSHFAVWKLPTVSFPSFLNFMCGKETQLCLFPTLGNWSFSAVLRHKCLVTLNKCSKLRFTASWHLLWSVTHLWLEDVCSWWKHLV